MYAYCNFSNKCFAEGDQIALDGHIRLYEPKKPTKKQGVFAEMFEVIPVTQILGKLPVMPDFSTKTIPFKYNDKAKVGFQHGMADTSEGAGNGSKLWYINIFALTWSRSKLSLFRYVNLCVLLVCATEHHDL